MAKVIDLTGNKYGRLTVISRATGKGKGSYWNCLCECGNYKVVSGQSLKTGGTKSCGCGKKDYYNRNNHGTQSPFYSTWGSMKARCNNPRHPAYKYYGGRGIKVCNEWNVFSAFRKWAEKTNTADSLTSARRRKPPAALS